MSITYKYLKFVTFLSAVIVSGSDNQPKIKCIENGRFYRNPDGQSTKSWTVPECSKYYLCLDGEVFDFQCSNGLVFDINRQICDLKFNVDNCDTAVETSSVPKPLLDEANCPGTNQLGCADGTCLPHDYFCDGSVDCTDESDEGHCDANRDPNAAAICNISACHLPDCFCSKDGTRMPAEIHDSSQIPQMIIVSFDDAINYDNWELYSETLFTGARKNPNGCPIKSTFYVSHEFNNYQLTQKLWNGGHEIAVHSITHQNSEDWWSHKASVEDWFDEMVGHANILHKFGNIRMESIRGLRVPYLNVGWNRQFLMMKEFGFVYDGSIIAPFSNPPLWPYTLDYQIPHRCLGKKQNCPTRSYPGVWEMVINPLEINENLTCPTLSLCPVIKNGLITGDDFYNVLFYNFNRHYLTNRAPYGLHFHSDLFKNSDYVDAFQKFIDEVLKEPDVWFVTNWQAIEWMKNPKTLNQIQDDFQAWNCNRIRFDQKELACKTPRTCKLLSEVSQKERYFYTCNKCPEKYPWIRNEFGID